MTISSSPLRYPGGKTCLTEPISKILRLNKLDRGHYAEPYAGGCGLALALLFEGHVSDIHINDIDRSVWTFWHVVLNRTDEFIELIQRTPVTVEEWRKQREIQRKPGRRGHLEIAFACFFLNRTNRSGIIKNAGVIGGLEQAGKYKIDCRFSKDELIRRIRRLSKYRNRIHLHRMDAIDFIDYVANELPDKTFLCIDPPYFNKGASLYTSFYMPEDHELVAKRILRLKNPWVLTYDHCEEIQDLYLNRRQYEFALNYSVQTKRIGAELLIASKGLRLPSEFEGCQVHDPLNFAA
ncbi:DNA adenine methylase [Bradyrhizobium symbiodeficiens]|uniref:DNA adenine methylase n=1 Tax=Bradyrhizobium symbiodeficiens TaxID=1404367 RepID=UPI0030D4BAA1